MPEKLSRDEAVVIGGGPAGCAAAVLLARAGRGVILLEKKAAAHDKVCGEFISVEAARYLRELGLDLPALGAQPVRQLRLFSGGSRLEADLPFLAWSLSRRRLDEALMESALRAGARVRRGEAVRELARRDGGWAISTGGPALIRTGSVFLASGKHDLRRWPRRHRRTRDMIAFKMHMRLNARQREKLRGQVEIHLFEGGYAGLELVEEGKANLCFLLRRELYRACGGRWPALLCWLGGQAPSLQRRLAGAVSLWPSPLAVYRVPYGYLHRPRTEVPGLYRLGDQMAVIPSFAGDGIAIALHSARLAVECFLSGADSAAYHRRARESFRPPLRNARLLEALLGRNGSRKAAFLLSRMAPGLTRLAIQRTRLPLEACPRSGSRRE